MSPTVGRIVHYQSDGTTKAAVVTQVAEDGTTVGLAVFKPTEMFFAPRVPFADEPTPGHWNWPPRVV